ncbi:hypothetical protein AYK20_05580 [Thermoplasmatales archaeon SG8-52-1]|nr:MAG: hypothetical protein AYK20_05580 [Thermoplasmatales archaeon SG8-52-1]
MRYIKINIVGSVSTMDDLEEIDTIAKVFVVAERMIDLTNDSKSEKNNTEPPVDIDKKINNNHELYNKKITLLSVRGFN